MRLLAWLFISLVSGCAHYVEMEAIRATVIDGSTERPLKGVHVVLMATAEQGTLTGHGGEHANLRIAEGVTDANGLIEFPAATINARPFMNGTQYALPNLLFFKSGYRPVIEGNPWVGLPTLEEVLRWRRNGSAVWLWKPQSDAEYIQFVSLLGNEIQQIYEYPPAKKCEWKRIPLMLQYLDRERSLIHARDPTTRVGLPSIDDLEQPYWTEKCGSARAFLRTFPDAK